MNRQKYQQIEHTVVKAKVGGESGPVDGNFRRPSVACTLAIRVNPRKFPASWAKILNITLYGKGVLMFIGVFSNSYTRSDLGGQN